MNETSDAYLAHHGIKGQKWGVRRFQNPDGSYTALGAANHKQLSKIDRKYDKLAKKDAKEYARAKMSYGEGAGNRRKLIKSKVEQRRKENEHYNKVFDEYLAQEDMSKHADAAKRERTAKDAAKTTKRAAKTAVKVLNTVAPLLHDDETDAYLAHHGIKGQKWGVRRFQNPDGSLTPNGRKRIARKEQRTLNSLDQSKVQKIYDIERYEKKAAKKVKKLENKDYRDSVNPFREDMRRASLKKNQARLQWAENAKNAVNKDYKEKVQKVIDRCKDQKLDVDITEGGKRWVDTHWRIHSGYAYIPIMRPYDGATKYKVSGLKHSDSYLAHHGIKGQKWGVRRFQNPDGSLTDAGKSRRSKTTHKMTDAQKVLGLTALSALAIGGSAYIANKKDFDFVADALTGQKMTDSIKRINERADSYDNLATTVAKNPFLVSPMDDVNIRFKIDKDLHIADFNLKQATRRYDELASKKVLLKLSKHNREKLKEAANNVQELKTSTDTLVRNSAKLKASLDIASDARRAEAYRRAREQADEWRQRYASTDQSRNRDTSNNQRRNRYTSNSQRRNRYTSNNQSNQPRTTQSTSRTKSTDRAADMKKKGVKVGTVAEESKNVRYWTKKVSDAQRAGTLTADMVEQLQNAKARKKLAVDNEQMQHGFICFCRKNIF